MHAVGAWPLCAPGTARPTNASCNGAVEAAGDSHASSKCHALNLNILLNACFENKTGCKEQYLRALLHLRNNINISY